VNFHSDDGLHSEIIKKEFMFPLGAKENLYSLHLHVSVIKHFLPQESRVVSQNKSSLLQKNISTKHINI